MITYKQENKAQHVSPELQLADNLSFSITQKQNNTMQIRLHKLATKSSPLNPFTLQKRYKKPANTAQTRLEHRTLDSHLDKLSHHLKRLTLILNLHTLMLKRKRGPYVSLQLTSRWKHILRLDNPGTKVGSFIKNHPHVFDLFTHPVKRNLCCRMRAGFVRLVEEERRVVRERVEDGVRKVRKLVMMSGSRGVGVKGLVLVRRELGLPEDWMGLEGFRVVGDRVELVEWDESLAREEVEGWREREWSEKWLSEFEVRYSFPVSFPTGFRMVPGFRGKLRDWQRLPYLKPYERNVERKRVRNCERYEKRAVAVLHEILSLTVEKMVEVERLSHFRKDLGFEVNIREVLLKHPGIFYISTKGGTQNVFLREAYSKGHLVESNPIYEVRRKMLDLVLLGRRNTKELKFSREVEGSGGDVSNLGAEIEEDYILPMLDSFEDRKTER